MLINEAMAKAFDSVPGGDSFRWTSLHGNIGGKHSSHTDGNNYGLSAIFLLGNFTGGRFRTANGTTLGNEDRSNITLVDGSSPHWSESFQGLRVSIVAFYHTGKSLLPVKDNAKLVKLGFRTRLTKEQE